jgi:hypothetical protein
MNNLHLHAVRRHAATTFHRCKASDGALGRSGHAMPVSTPRNDAALPLRAQWFRNTVSGVLECCWAPQVPAEPLPRLSAARRPSLVRMHRRVYRVGMRPPSHKRANG